MRTEKHENDACMFSKRNENYRLHVSLISEDFGYQNPILCHNPFTAK